MKEVEVMQRSQRSGLDFRRIEQVRRALDTDQWKELAYSTRLAGIGAKLRHDAVNDWVEDLLR